MGVTFSQAQSFGVSYSFLFFVVFTIGTLSPRVAGAKRERKHDAKTTRSEGRRTRVTEKKKGREEAERVGTPGREEEQHDVILTPLLSLTFSFFLRINVSLLPSL